MHPEQHDPIEALLREQFNGPVADDGFTDQLMQHLPVQRQRVRWPLWIGMTLGALGGWLSIASVPWLGSAWHALLHGHYTPAAMTLLICVAAITLIAGCWSLAESEQ